MLLSWALSAKESEKNRIAAAMVPKRMNGVLLPRRLRQRSEIAPNSGSMNRAIRLSRTITNPEPVCERPNLLVRVSGMMLS